MAGLPGRARQRGPTLEAAAVLTALTLIVRLSPARAASRLFMRLDAELDGRTRVEPASAGLVAEDVGMAVRRAARYVPGSSCLAQALTAKLMLRRRCVPSEIKLGVARKDGAISAHAWLEHRGRVLVGAEQARTHVKLARPR